MGTVYAATGPIANPSLRASWYFKTLNICFSYDGRGIFSPGLYARRKAILFCSFEGGHSFMSPKSKTINTCYRYYCINNCIILSHNVSSLFFFCTHMFNRLAFRFRGPSARERRQERRPKRKSKVFFFSFGFFFFPGSRKEAVRSVGSQSSEHWKGWPDAL